MISIANAWQLPASRQPNFLYLLCASELGERFSHYILRSLLVLYMIKVLLFTQEHAYGVFAGFSALLYLSPLFGGYLTDRMLSLKLAITLGGVLLTAGYCLLAMTEATPFLYAGLAIIIIGSGLFMPNIVGLVGKLYSENDSRRESGFSIFYAAINIGALLAPLIIAFVVTKYGWHTGFSLAAIGTLFSTLLFYAKSLHFSKPGSTVHSSNKIKSKWRIDYVVIAGFVIATALFFKLIEHPHYVMRVVFGTGICFFLYAIIQSLAFPKIQRNRLLVCFYLTLFSIVFEMLFQQSAMSMMIFIEHHVQRGMNGWTMPTIVFQALNPFFIILCAPIFSKLWIYLETKNCNPSVPAKFAYGTLLTGLGFAIFPLAIHQSQAEPIHLGWIAFSYLLQSCGELLVSPIGLSMLTAMAPRHMAGLMIGLWYFAIAVGQALAGVISQWTTIASFTQTFGTIGLIAMTAGILTLFVAPRFSRMLMARDNHL